ncbi:hypothetical protein ACQEVB_35690 [Pseudonocardia sp. CA-107938]|uniref:hypothetical protein n=1 Tax=Pseudonocardia sp. CA-107938 TaxID=3240021 RepID=UPI003D8FAA70
MTTSLPDPNRFLRPMQGAALILGAALFAASTFFWLPTGTYGAASGTVIVLALVFMTYGLLGLLEDMRERLPLYSSIVGLVLVYGAFGGAAFGVRGLYDELFHFSRQASTAAVETFPLAADLLFYWPGPLFPLSLLAIGIGLARSRTSPLWAALLLCAAGVAFPFSRVPRVGWVAHVVDAAILLAFAYLGYRRLQPQRRLVAA